MRHIEGVRMHSSTKAKMKRVHIRIHECCGVRVTLTERHKFDALGSERVDVRRDRFVVVKSNIRIPVITMTSKDASVFEIMRSAGSQQTHICAHVSGSDMATLVSTHSACVGDSVFAQIHSGAIFGDCVGPACASGPTHPRSSTRK